MIELIEAGVCFPPWDGALTATAFPTLRLLAMLMLTVSLRRSAFFKSRL